jgi:SAM-dependent methyltransferase
VLVSSRSYDEYVAMFDLGDGAMVGRRVLDCSAGAASFVLHARPHCALAVAVDPAYALPKDVLADTAAASHQQGSTIAVDNADRFTWAWYGSREARDRMRVRARAEFLLDRATHPSSYVAASLPRLPFRAATFDLALCSHLLLTWADELGLDWHAAAFRELARVAAEVRIFPTVLRNHGEPVPFWDELMSTLAADGLDPQLREVPYEFQLGGNTMLVVTRSRSRSAR